MNSTEKFFVECVKAGITKGQIEKLPTDIDYKILYGLCCSHAVPVIVYTALQGVYGLLPNDFSVALNKLFKRYLMLDMQSSFDTENLLNEFEREGIKHMPLKGYNLKKYYPESCMRYTSDCDILIDVNELKKVRKVCYGLGLKKYRYDNHHDMFYAPISLSLFELHKMMFVGKLGEHLNYGFDYLQKKPDKNFQYELKIEDLYISILAHSAYHFINSAGVGIRHLTDIYLFKKNNLLDYEYIDKKLEQSSLLTFKNEFEKLSEYFFEGKEASEFTLKLADYVLKSTVLENNENKTASRVSQNTSGANKSGSKIKTIFSMFFPDVEKMKYQFPILKKAIWLLPIMYVIRWFVSLIKRPKTFLGIFHIVKTKKEDIGDIKEMREKLGIN